MSQRAIRSRSTVVFGLSLAAISGLLLLPAVGTFAPSGERLAPIGSHAPSSPGARSTPPPVLSLSAALAGSDPRGERAFDAPALARSLSAGLPTTGGPPGGSPAVPPAAASADPAVVTPNYATGSVSGYIYDSITAQPVPAATVQAILLSGTPCPITLCQSVASDGAGYFHAVAPAGLAEIDFSDALHLANKTWTTVSNNSNSYLGTLYLVHDAWATGVVEADLVGHPPVGGVNVSSQARDGLGLTNSTATTAPNGSFRIALPPLPSELVFDVVPTAPAVDPYAENYTFVNASPYENVSLGTIYLEGDVPVTAHFYDRVTGLPIPHGTAAELKVCTRRSGYCLQSVEAGYNGSITKWGLPGPSFVRAYALGYVVNQTTIAPLSNTVNAVDIGRVNLTPLAGFELSSNFTGTTAAPPAFTTVSVAPTICSLSGMWVANFIPSPPNLP